jgi:hypothetical protein
MKPLSHAPGSAGIPAGESSAFQRAGKDAGASRPSSVSVVQLGAGLIGRFLGPLIATAPNVDFVRLIDRDVFTQAQAMHPGESGRPKAEVVAETMQALNPRLSLEPRVADIENLPLGLLRCDILLTALDSKRARIAANYAFRKLGIRYWIDSGVSAPWLARVSVFAQGQDAPCYECALGTADYASEQSYPCQPHFSAPPTNSPQFLGSLAASLQAAEFNRLLSGQFDPAVLNRELVYDASARKLVLTRLMCQPRTCRLDHAAFNIRFLKRGPRQITLGEMFAMGNGAVSSKAQPAARLEVPGKLFVRELNCQCGERSQRLHLKGRFKPADQRCAHCGKRMAPTGRGLTDVLMRNDLSRRDLHKPLSSLGLLSGDVIAVGNGRRTQFFELAAS